MQRTVNMRRVRVVGGVVSGGRERRPGRRRAPFQGPRARRVQVLRHVVVTDVPAVRVVRQSARPVAAVQCRRRSQ